MKNKIALASAFLAASSLATAEIVINDFLSFEGFVDMSYSATDLEVGAAETNNNSYALDQVEISWLFDFDPVTAQIDVQHLDGQGTSVAGSTIEQAFATYHMDNGAAITAGRFASMLGFEAFEPTGLYQYSFAYTDLEDVNFSPFIASGGVLPGYDQGVKYTYEGDSTFFGVSIVDGVNVGRLGGPVAGGFGGAGDSGFSVEVAGAINSDNGLSWFGGARYDEGDNTFGASFDDQYILNTHVTFETGAWIFAGELVYADADFGATNREVFQALLMANFAYSEVASVTGRVSYVGADNGAAVNSDDNFVKYTLAHGYAFTDNLFLVNEISYLDGETTANADVKALTAAVELIFSF